MSKPDDTGIVLSAEEKARQKKRSRAIGFAIAGVVFLFYVITIFKIGPTIMNRSM